MSNGGRSDDADLINQLREALGSTARDDLSNDLESVPVEESSDSLTVAPADDSPVRTGPVVSRAALDIADSILETRESSRSAPDKRQRASGAMTGHICLIVAGKEVLVPPGGTVLGRQPGPAGVVVANSHISRRHISLMPVEGGVSVGDLGSTNGTVIVRGGDQVEVGAAPTPVEPGDTILTTDGVHIADVVSVSYRLEGDVG